MPTTTTYGLRYPADTDRVADGAVAIGNLAADVDAALAAQLVIASYVPIPFHVTGTLVAGVKPPRFIAPRAMTLRLAKARNDTGTGSAYRLVVNGVAAAATAHTAVGVAVLTNDFADVALAAGDALQVEVTAPGTGTDLSVTVLATLS